MRSYNSIMVPDAPWLSQVSRGRVGVMLLSWQRTGKNLAGESWEMTSLSLAPLWSDVLQQGCILVLSIF